MSIDPSKLPPAQYVPGRQYAIEHAGRIDKVPFVITTGLLFGLAILSVFVRFAIRIFGGRKIRWDDGLVLVSSLCLAVAFACVHKALNPFYLVEAINQRKTIPFREDIPAILDIPKWAFIFSIFGWNSIYLVKFAFMYFFHGLTLGLSVRVVRFFWITAGFLVIAWIYAVVNFVVICAHFGADAAKCGDAQMHKRSVAGNVIVGVLDIIGDILIVTVPIVVVNQSMMSFSRKLSIVALMGLSAVMVVCALIRVVGSLTETTAAAFGTAPVWAAYWFMVESCVALIMASVIVIRGVFITNPVDDDRRKQDSVFQRFGHRILSVLRLSRSSRSSGRSPQRSDALHGKHEDPSAPRIATQRPLGGTLNTVRTFIWGGKRQSPPASQDDPLVSVNTTSDLGDMDYHNIRKAEVARHKPEMAFV